MIVLSGASASGKTEAAKVLMQKYGVVKIITTTTRKMRKGEVDGRDYFFVSPDKFKEMIDNDEFVEYTFYNNNYYGSTKDQIKSNRCVVIDPSGLKAYVSLKDPTIITFFLECDEETRHARMLLRGDNKEDADARIINDREAFKHENTDIADYRIDSQHNSIDEVAKMVIDLYHKTLKERQLEK